MFLLKRHLESIVLSAVVLLLQCFCLFTATPYVVASETARPIWTIDLKKYGIRTPKRGFSLIGTLNDPGSLFYVALSTSTVAVVFDSQRNKTTQIAALFLDGKTGNVVGQQSWIGDLDYRRQIFATSNGNFVLLTSGQEDGPPPILHLLSTTGKELKRAFLHQSEGRSGRWEVLSSPSGRSFLLIHEDRGTPDSFQLLDANTLDLRSTWSRTETAKLFVEAISDEDVLFSTSDRDLIGRFNGPWQNILLLSRPQFLTEDSIISSSPDGSVNVIRDDGQQLNGFRAGVSLAGSAGHELEMHIPFVSADGQRFGAVLDERRPFPTPPTRTIDVWQELGKELIFAAPLDWSGYGFGPQATLSADGLLLVAVNTPKVHAYKLPRYKDETDRNSR